MLRSKGGINLQSIQGQIQRLSDSSIPIQVTGAWSAPLWYVVGTCSVHILWSSMIIVTPLQRWLLCWWVGMERAKIPGSCDLLNINPVIYAKEKEQLLNIHSVTALDGKGQLPPCGASVQPPASPPLGASSPGGIPDHLHQQLPLLGHTACSSLNLHSCEPIPQKLDIELVRHKLPTKTTGEFCKLKTWQGQQ